MTLTKKQVSFLRSQAHPLEPHLQLGKEGASDAFKKQLESALARQELVKIRQGRRVEVDLQGLAEGLNATLIQKVGRVFVLYRPAKEPVIRLPEG